MDIQIDSGQIDNRYPYKMMFKLHYMIFILGISSEIDRQTYRWILRQIMDRQIIDIKIDNGQIDNRYPYKMMFKLHYMIFILGISSEIDRYYKRWIDIQIDNRYSYKMIFKLHYIYPLYHLWSFI